jgi:hypothetical protein
MKVTNFEKHTMILDVPADVGSMTMPSVSISVLSVLDSTYSNGEA